MEGVCGTHGFPFYADKDSVFCAICEWKGTEAARDAALAAKERAEQERDDLANRLEWVARAPMMEVERDQLSEEVRENNRLLALADALAEAIGSKTIVRWDDVDRALTAYTTARRAGK